MLCRKRAIRRIPDFKMGVGGMRCELFVDGELLQTGESVARGKNIAFYL